MLELRPNCEHCNKALPNSSSEAMICSYECTFCTACVESILANVCPNCGGGFESRPSRPQAQLDKYPPIKSGPYKRVELSQFQQIRDINKNIDPRKR